MDFFNYRGSGKVLVADADAREREALSIHLHVLGYRVAVARTGADVPRLIREFDPGCMVLDLHMPGLDGFEVLERLGASVLEHVPTLVVGDQLHASDVRRALALGARDVLSKPFQDTQLYFRLARLRRDPAHRLAATA